MRRPVDAARIRAFMAALGRSAAGEHTVYVVGGATAVLEGWRESTIDIDIDIALSDREAADELLRALPAIKESLELNVELASPADFVPVPAAFPDERDDLPLPRGQFAGRRRRAPSRHRAVAHRQVRPCAASSLCIDGDTRYDERHIDANARATDRGGTSRQGVPS
jgi:hypothetical protein